GKYVHRVGRNSKWSRILWNGRKLYAASDYLSPYPPETSAEEKESAAAESGEAATETGSEEAESPEEERNEEQ
ncbi:MAG: hypothetical protein IJT43_07570, partial [Stomatobaculum sp.]|nr:hypothetical protein [Stomatobaculum sp.]